VDRHLGIIPRSSTVGWLGIIETMDLGLCQELFKILMVFTVPRKEKIMES